MNCITLEMTTMTDRMIVGIFRFEMNVIDIFLSVDVRFLSVYDICAIILRTVYTCWCNSDQAIWDMPTTPEANTFRKIQMALSEWWIFMIKCRLRCVCVRVCFCLNLLCFVSSIRNSRSSSVQTNKQTQEEMSGRMRW